MTQPILEIRGLHAELEREDDTHAQATQGGGAKEILRGLDLTLERGKIHAVMGPNGSGKSTLAYMLAGRPGYHITAGTVNYDGQNLLDMEADARAQAGIFLAFQYPVEIPGVNSMVFSARRL